MTLKQWAGRAVQVMFRDHRSNFPVQISLSEEAARKLALSLGRLRQTYSMGLMPEAEEVYQALNYVLVGDPASVALHAKMEASKGMTPDGGHKSPNPRPLRATDIQINGQEPVTDPGLRAQRRRGGEFFRG